MSFDDENDDDPVVDPFAGIDLDEAHEGGVVLGTDVDQILRGESEHGEVPRPDRSVFQDEWSRDLQRRSEARVIDGKLVGELDAEIQEKNLKRIEDSRIAPYVRTNPASVYGAVLGAQATVTSGTISPNLVWWQGDQEEATSVTITLSIVGSAGNTASNIGTGGATWPAATVGGTAASYRPYARVTWGSRGFMSTADVDMNKGNQLVVSGSCVYVAVGMDPAQAGYVAGTMTLAVQLSFSPRQTIQPITRTAFIDALGNNGTQRVITPAFAQQVLSVQRVDTATGKTMPAIDFQFRDTNAAVLYYSSLALGGAFAQSIPLTTDCYDMLVTNNGAAANIRIMFGLSL